MTKMPAHNLRFGATAGRADLKGGGGVPSLRQAAWSLYANRRERGGASERARALESFVLPDSVGVKYKDKVS
jgi:hypothetical protein